MKTLPIQPLREAYWRDVEDQLKSAFYDIIFKPLVEIAKKGNPTFKNPVNTLLNATTGALMEAIRSGRIQYDAGTFSGNFNVATSRDLRSIGAVLDPRNRLYKVAVENVPDAIRAEAASYKMRAQAVHDAIKRKLDEIEKNLQVIVEKHKIDAEETVRRVDKGFEKSAELLEVQPRLGADAKERLAEDYTNNISKYIEEFSRQSIKSLREDVEDNALAGYRFDRLTEVIRHRYGVTANKARFLARQETGLFMSQYRKQRFTEAGVRRYRWSTAHDERVRSSHKELNGRVFSYDQPPITDTATGARNNPGEDYNCRCVDIPILEGEAVAA